jgi:hypothetical protein
MLFTNPVRTSKRTPHFTITKINWLTLFKFNIIFPKAPHSQEYCLCYYTFHDHQLFMMVCVGVVSSPEIVRPPVRTVMSALRRIMFSTSNFKRGSHRVLSWRHILAPLSAASVPPSPFEPLESGYTGACHAMVRFCSVFQKDVPVSIACKLHSRHLRVWCVFSVRSW